RKIMKKLLFLFVCLNMSFTAERSLAQGKKAQRPIDSLQAVIKTAADNGSKVKSLIDYADMIRPDSTDEAIRYQHKALSLAKKIKSPGALADVNISISNYYESVDLTDSAMFYALSSLVSLKETNDTLRIGRVFNSLSYLERRIVTPTPVA